MTDAPKLALLPADLIKKLDETYAAIDSEWRLYSEKANSKSETVRAEAKGHADEAERLRAVAHGITEKLAGK